MPNASDGKKFPYTKEGMADYKKYQGSLDRKNFTMGMALGKSQLMAKNELRAKYARNLSNKSYTEEYKKSMGFEHKVPGWEVIFRKQPVPDFLSNPVHGTGKTKSIKNRAMTDKMITGGKKKLVKGT